MTNPASSAHLQAGDAVPVRSFTTMEGRTIDVAGQQLPTHIQFRRFAGCPVCSLHLASFVRRKNEVDNAVSEIVVFHSSAEDLMLHAPHLPFDIVADPEKDIYRAFGVESSTRALLDRRAWPTIVRAVAHSLPDVLSGRKPSPPLMPAGGRYGLPADFLVAPGRPHRGLQIRRTCR